MLSFSISSLRSCAEAQLFSIINGKMGWITPPSPEWRLVKGAKLAGMQRISVFPKEVERAQADPQVLRNGALIKGAGRPRQFDFAMRRFVRNAKERPIGHA